MLSFVLKHTLDIQIFAKISHALNKIMQIKYEIANCT